MLAALSENWWALVLRGLLAMLFGCAALFLQLDTLEAVGRVFGAYAITEGVLLALTGIRRTRYRGGAHRRRGVRHRGRTGGPGLALHHRARAPVRSRHLGDTQRRRG